MRHVSSFRNSGPTIRQQQATAAAHAQKMRKKRAIKVDFFTFTFNLFVMQTDSTVCGDVSAMFAEHLHGLRDNYGSPIALLPPTTVEDPGPAAATGPPPPPPPGPPAQPIPTPVPFFIIVPDNAPSHGLERFMRSPVTRSATSPRTRSFHRPGTCPCNRVHIGKCYKVNGEKWITIEGN